jgi:glycerol-3-phosphate cytidylyltransferase-like family protein
LGGWEFIYLHIKQSHVHLLVQTKNLTGALLEVQECVVIGEVFQEKKKKLKKKQILK